MDTRFLRINVEHAPFLVDRLKVRILPCVVAFVDGIGVDRIIGFEGLGHGDSFTLGNLETRLLRSGVLVRAKLGKEDGANLTKGVRPVRGKAQEQGDDDNDDDDD